MVQKFWRVMFVEGICLKFFGPAGGRSLRARVPYMTRRAALPKSNAVTGVVCAVRGYNGFCYSRVFIVEFFEICKCLVETVPVTTVKLYLSRRGIEATKQIS